ncbi:hypothetical protein [Paenibacillus sp. W2I17]|uniref:hypothetical protein n=1 Tax=Paenibacillus sp. W2I17 TaxID=3042311 RepID=UPI00277D8802|nr:hypothetical protein [Paenibacillus sp. W2I17]MDQ0657834.1 hypothetical protein [Paenibacillus sp. W2I17]
MKTLIPLPAMPEFLNGSPEITKLLDKIRFELEKQDDEGYYFEFGWFVREYSRAYRYHIQCSEYRLEKIFSIYKDAFDYFEDQIQNVEDNCFGMSFSNRNSNILYWEFESYLSSINVALDLLARIIGTAYKDHMPPSFNKICKKDLDGPIRDLQNAKAIWVTRLKDYRDCFIHYTPVDTLLNISANLYSKGWEVRAKIPVNPNAREIMNFKYSRRVELLNYSISIYKHMRALDKRISKTIFKLYKKKQYPVRISNLFSIGVRE